MDSHRRAILLTVETRRELWTWKGIFYWRIRRNRYLGYQYRGGNGKWWARMRCLDGREKQTMLGLADDNEPANGLTVSNFYQALAKAEEWFDLHQGIGAPDRKEYQAVVLFPDVPLPPPYTIANAAKDYANWLRVHRKSLSSMYYILKNQIIAPLGHIPVTELDAHTIERWHSDLVEALPVLSNTYLSGVTYGEKGTDEAYFRRRKSTANTHLSILKSVMNRAYAQGYVDSDRAWAVVKPFKGCRSSPRVDYLEKDQIVALLKECPDDLGNLVRAALLTGCRVGELMNLRVCDFHTDLNRVVVYRGKVGKLGHVSLSKEGIGFFKKICAGRRGDEVMLLRSDGRPWSYYVYRQIFMSAQKRAGIQPQITFHGLRHTYASHAAMAGLPLKAIADQLGHSTTKMVDTYYAHLSKDYLDEVIRKKMPRLFS